MANDVEQRVVADPGSAPMTEAPLPPAAPATAPAAKGGAPVVASPEITRPGSRSDKDVAYWRGVIDEWNALLDAARLAGGLLPSIRGFCRERKLRETSFYWWRRELAIRDGKPLPTMRAMDSTRVAGHRPAKAEPCGTFVQLKVRPTAPASTNALCELVVGKVVVRVAPGFDASELSRLLDVLHAR